MKFVSLLSVLMVLSSCSGAVPELHQYLLRADSAAPAVTSIASREIGIGNLVIASYIDGPGLILETQSGQVHSARDHQWAEPLRESLRIFLARQIAVAADRPIAAQHLKNSHWQQRIDIRIDQLHGGRDGSAVLVAYWQITNNQKSLVDHEFIDSEPLIKSGYAALVKAQKRLLERLSSAIAASL
ncbi:MAG: membrane integrity-associated transporter subunit PqiC [Immundisolibacteraceae bacterium]|nr:membrane integrity-associated transporter subunit PqiC [Immundisolibacteraceae bacterium]